MMGSQTTVLSLRHIPKYSQFGSGLDSVSKQNVEMMSHAPEPLFDSFILMNPGVILKHIDVIIEQSLHRCSTLVIQVHLTSFYGHIMLLNQDLTNCTNLRPHRLAL